MKKGFALIELLAVIVILAIIALITVPIVINIISNSKKGAAEASSTHYIKMVDDKIALATLDTDLTNDINDGVISIVDIQVDLSGTRPTAGVLTVENSRVKEATLIIDGFVVVYDGTSEHVSDTLVTRYVYWSLAQGGDGIEYSNTSIPSTVYDSATKLGYSSPFPLIRTTMIGNTPIEHESCLYYNNKMFCMKKDYWEESFEKTHSKLQRDMKNILGVTPTTCQSNPEKDEVLCSVYKTGEPLFYSYVRSISISSSYVDHLAICYLSHNSAACRTY